MQQQTSNAPPIPFNGPITDAEQALIDEITAEAEQVRRLQARVEHFCIGRHNTEKTGPNYVAHTTVTEPMRWAGIARTELQQGFMALKRAVAAPVTF